MSIGVIYCRNMIGTKKIGPLRLDNVPLFCDQSGYSIENGEKGPRDTELLIFSRSKRFPSVYLRRCALSGTGITCSECTKQNWVP